MLIIGKVLIFGSGGFRILGVVYTLGQKRCAYYGESAYYECAYYEWAEYSASNGKTWYWQ